MWTERVRPCVAALIVVGCGAEVGGQAILDEAGFPQDATPQRGAGGAAEPLPRRDAGRDGGFLSGAGGAPGTGGHDAGGRDAGPRDAAGPDAWRDAGFSGDADASLEGDGALQEPHRDSGPSDGSTLDVAVTDARPSDSSDADGGGLEPNCPTDGGWPATDASARRVLYVSQNTGADRNAGTTWSDAFRTLEAALARATACTEVWIAEGTYVLSTSDRWASFLVPDRVALRGGFSGDETDLNQRDMLAHPTVLSGDILQPGIATDNTVHVVHTLGAAELDGLSISAGHADLAGAFGEGPDAQGGGVLADGPLTVERCSFSDNYADWQGGAIRAAGDIWVRNSSFSANRGGRTSAIYVGGQGVLENTRFLRNATGVEHEGDGGAVSLSLWDSRLSVKDCAFEASSPSTAAAITAWGGEVVVTDTTFESNEGAAIRNWFGSVTLTRATVTRNGLGVYAHSATIVDSTFVGNGEFAVRAQGYESTLTVQRSRFEMNGAGIIADGPGRISDSEFISNGKAELGGAIKFEAHPSDGVSLVQRSLFDSNSVTDRGGAIFTSGAIDIVDSTFLGNSSDGSGGALAGYSLAHMRLSRCRFSGNVAASAGGVIDAESDVDMKGCEATRNSAPTGSFLVRSYADPGAQIAILNSTVAFNQGSTGAAIAYRGDVVIRNSLLWGNAPTEIAPAPGLPAAGGILTIATSHVEGRDSASDPLFVDGPAGDLRLSDGSPCIDRADDTFAPLTDIDGRPRLDQPGVPLCSPDAGACGSSADIGAHEFGY